MALLERAIGMGGLLYTETLVQSISPGSTGPTTVSTSRGTIKASKVVFATNGYSTALLPQYTRVICPVKGQASHLSPDPATHHGLNLVPTYNLHYDSSTVDYLVPRLDGTIILGGGSGHFRADKSKWFDTVDDSTLISDQVTEHFDGVMAKHFRGWEKSNAKADFVWTGSTCHPAPKTSVS
jgi:glycine/D-amino acid oxidase-like deaminating enzyme